MKLALIYFIRSINVRGIMLALQCYQIRTNNNINVGVSASGNVNGNGGNEGGRRKSQLMPVGG